MTPRATIIDVKPNCMCCRDTGIVGGDSYPFAFCLCSAGSTRKEKEPEWVNEANKDRERLMMQFGGKTCG